MAERDYDKLLKTMEAYICVYHHRKSKQRKNFKNKLVNDYWKAYPNCFYDLGDDPSFFCSDSTNNPVTWGVCRPNLRKRISRGDIVIYFCAQHNIYNPNIIDYYYIGFGVCADLLLTRKERIKIWKNPRKYPFQSYFNILIDRKNKHKEYIEKHRDWRKRTNAPYIIFDKEQNNFNLTSPLHVAIFNKKVNKIERWKTSRKVKILRKVIFTANNVNRYLRTSNRYIPHQYIHINDVKDNFLNRLQAIKI